MKKITKILMVLAVVAFTLPKTYAQISVGVSVRLAPPALPVYVQPECPVDGYLWQPGYWAYDDADGYYWVPGVWVAPPNPGLLWTPAYWGFAGGFYGFHAGYWGPHVGFYGGINYGFGYGGVGFVGGGWSGNRFRYNTAVVNVNRTVIHNTYIDRTVVHNTTINNRTSFNGPGGVNARPRPQELAAARDHHIQATSQQMSHQQSARSNRSSFASVNHGRPATPAVNRVSSRPFNNNNHAAPSPSHSGFGNHATTQGRPANQPQQHQEQARPQPQQHQAQPQQHMQQPRPQPQQHQEQPRPQPQQHAQPQQQHMQQPRPQPQQHNSAPHGGGGGRHH